MASRNQDQAGNAQQKDSDETIQGLSAQGRREGGYGGGGFASTRGAAGGYEDPKAAERDDTYGGMQPDDFRRHYSGPSGDDARNWGAGPRGARHTSGQAFDPDYAQWREEQLRRLDEDYQGWRQERYKKFSDEFSSWRTTRQGAAAGSAQGGERVSDSSSGTRSGQSPSASSEPASDKPSGKR